MMEFKIRLNDFFNDRKKYAQLHKGLYYVFAGFIAIVLIQIVSYFGFMSSIPNFLGRYGWWLFYLDLSVATLSGAVWYMASYKSRIACMLGMMLGMTVGMQTGMMLGAVVGATNGFFIGAMAGMILGVIAGTFAGASSGTMGALQGMMSGVMGGTMGAMITVMMFSDNVLLFMPFYMVINVAILAGNSLMYYEEIVENKENVTKRDMDLMSFLAANIIIAFVLMLIMVYGPKSFLFNLG
jgi:hypothetical protein